jgi:hypothetical protein
MRIRVILASMLGMASMPASALATDQSPSGGPLGPVSDIVVEAVGEGPADVDCSRFQTTSTRLLDFLRHAVVISPRDLHDAFAWGPCTARGTLSTRYGTWHWTLREGGTALLRADADDENIMLGDPREEASTGGRPMP